MNFTKIPSVERNRAKQKRPPGSSRCTASSTVLTPGSLLRFAAGTPPGPSSGACPPHSVLSPCISAALLPLGKFFLRKDGYCHLPLHAQKYTPSLLSTAQSLHGIMSKLAEEDELKLSGLFIFLAV